jgi:hypothetical protein
MAMSGMPMRAMTEEEIVAAAVADPDARAMTVEQLGKAGPAHKNAA